jgi:hypothetical protein
MDTSLRNSAMIDLVQKDHNAERSFVAPLQGADSGRGLLPWAVLGCPFGAANGQILDEKLKF